MPAAEGEGGINGNALGQQRRQAGTGMAVVEGEVAPMGTPEVNNVGRLGLDGGRQMELAGARNWLGLDTKP